MRVAFAFLAMVLLAAGCASGESPAIPRPTTSLGRPSKPSTPGEVARTLEEALGCTSTEDGPPKDTVAPARLVRSVECFRQQKPVARIQVYEPADSVEQFRADIIRRFQGRYIDAETLSGNSPCKTFSPGVVVGDSWVVLTPTESSAPSVAAATGGQVSTPLDSGPIVSYLPPPLCAGG